MSNKFNLKIAYCVEAANKEYLIGCLRIGQRMKYLGSKYPVIVLVNDTISDDNLTEFYKSNIEVRKFSEANFLLMTKNTSAAFESLNLIDYDFIYNIEADMLPLYNIDKYVEHYIRLIDEPYNIFMCNGRTGHMFIKPNKDVYNVLKNDILSIGNCDIVEEYFMRHRTNQEFLECGKYINFSALNVEDPDGLLHFPFSCKPWENNLQICGKYMENYCSLDENTFNKFIDETADWWLLYHRLSYICRQFNSNPIDERFLIWLIEETLKMLTDLFRMKNKKNLKLINRFIGNFK